MCRHKFPRHLPIRNNFLCEFVFWVIQHDVWVSVALQRLCVVVHAPLSWFINEDSWIGSASRSRMMSQRWEGLKIGVDLDVSCSLSAHFLLVSISFHKSIIALLAMTQLSRNLASTSCDFRNPSWSCSLMIQSLRVTFDLLDDARELP